MRFNFGKKISERKPVINVQPSDKYYPVDKTTSDARNSQCIDNDNVNRLVSSEPGDLQNMVIPNISIE